jgi:hypothetical protein
VESRSVRHPQALEAWSRRTPKNPRPVRSAKLPMTMLAGSGTAVEKLPAFCAVKPAAMVPLTLLNERADPPKAGGPPIWAWIGPGEG